MRGRYVAFAAAALLSALCAIIEWHADSAVRRGAAIAVGTLVLWISEVAPLGVVAILIPIAAASLGILTWPQAVAAWGDPIVFLFLGAFLLARALDKHGAFDWVLRLRWTGQGSSAGLTTLGILVLSGLISTLQNNTAVTAMLLPVALRMAQRSRAPASVMLALAWGATFGGMATPVGTAPNFIGYAAMKRLDPEVGFLSWMQVGVPVWIGTTLIGWTVLLLAGHRGRARSGAGDNLAVIHDRSSQITDPSTSTVRAEHVDLPARRWALAVFGAAAVVWLGSGVVLSMTSPDDAIHQWVRRYLPESLVPIALAWLLFLVRTGPERRPMLDRHDFQALDWDTLFLIAGGLTLGRVLETSGAAAALAQAVAGAQMRPWLMMLALAGATTLLSELTSNTATASLMVPIAGALGPAVGLSAVEAVWLVALSASLGFALPVSTPPNALVYGTRLVPLRFMAATGIAVDVLSVVWVTCCVAWLA